MMYSLFRYAFPAAVIFGLGGFFVGSTMNSTNGIVQPEGKSRDLNPRETFLSNEDDSVDYTKLARVCLAAASRKCGAQAEANLSPSPVAEPDSPRVMQAKESLDEVMSISLERGTWSRGAGLRARVLLKRLPESDVVDFASLFNATVKSGKLSVGSGAWVPRWN